MSKAIVAQSSRLIWQSTDKNVCATSHVIVKGYCGTVIPAGVTDIPVCAKQYYLTVRNIIVPVSWPKAIVASSKYKMHVILPYPDCICTRFCFVPKSHIDIVFLPEDEARNLPFGETAIVPG